MSFKDLRRALRLEVSGDVITRIVAGNQTVRLIDIGPGGFLIETPVPVAPGTTHRIEFTTSDGWSTTLTARSAHSRRRGSAGDSPTYAVGFAFLFDPAEHTEQSVARLIDRITAVLSFD